MGLSVVGLSAGGLYVVSILRQEKGGLICGGGGGGLSAEFYGTTKFNAMTSIGQKIKF